MSLLNPRPTGLSCDGNCRGCAAGADADDPQVIRGAPLALWSAVVFLLPLVGLAVGAALAGGTGARAVVGALAGGMVGVVLARTALRFRSPNLLPERRTPA